MGNSARKHATSNKLTGKWIVGRKVSGFLLGSFTAYFQGRTVGFRECALLKTTMAGNGKST